LWGVLKTRKKTQKTPVFLTHGGMDCTSDGEKQAKNRRRVVCFEDTQKTHTKFAGAITDRNHA
jgi:hypothetical protein